MPNENYHYLIFLSINLINSSVIPFLKTPISRRMQLFSSLPWITSKRPKRLLNPCLIDGIQFLQCLSSFRMQKYAKRQVKLPLREQVLRGVLWLLGYV